MGFLINPYKFVYGPVATFEDDYTTNTGWTQTGSTITVDSIANPNQLKFLSTSGGTTDRVTKSLGVTLSDTLWYAEFDFVFSSGTTIGDNPLFIAFLLSAGTSDQAGTSQDGLGFMGYKSGGTSQVFMYKKDGASQTSSPGVTITLGTTYYIRLERTTATNLKMSVFTDISRTTHQTGSPINFGISSGTTGLTHIQHATYSAAGSSSITASVDNTKIYNDATP